MDTCFVILTILVLVVTCLLVFCAPLACSVCLFFLYLGCTAGCTNLSKSSSLEKSVNIGLIALFPGVLTSTSTAKMSSPARSCPLCSCCKLFFLFSIFLTSMSKSIFSAWSKRHHCLCSFGWNGTGISTSEHSVMGT